MEKLSSKLGVQFKNIDLLKNALTHSSYANQHNGLKSNEKLEFLGDAVLQLSITEHLYKRLLDKEEGELTKIKSLIVCEASLYQIAIKWGLGDCIKLSRGEEITGGRNRASLLADATEAVIAAIFLDKGMDFVKRFILENFKELIDKACNNELVFDYKTRLQELLQENGEINIHYDLIKSEGPPHRRKFFSLVAIDEIIMGRGEGMSKKESEQEAAKDALSKLVVRERS